jgi:hypothetical protein
MEAPALSSTERFGLVANCTDQTQKQRKLQKYISPTVSFRTKKDQGRRTYRRSRLDISLSGVPFHQAVSLQSHSKILQVAPARNRVAHPESLQAKIIVYRDFYILLRPKIAFGSWIEEWPSRNLICSRSPPFFRQSLAQVRRRSWAPKCSIPICFDDCSTIDIQLLTRPPSRSGCRD